MITLSAAERHRLARILGMLGSDHQGERDNAARQAEIFRRKHQLTWAELLALPPVDVTPEPLPPSAPPERPVWTPPPQPASPRQTPPQPYTTLSEVGRLAMIFAIGTSPITIMILAEWLARFQF